MGKLGTGIGLLFGGILGAASSAYYLRARTAGPEPHTLASENASLRRVLEARTGELEELRVRFKELQEKSREAPPEVGMFHQRSAQLNDWQDRVPAVVNLGQRLAQVADIKLASANAAVAARVFPDMANEPQDLSDIVGLGSAFEQRLYEAGIGTYWEVGNLPDEELQRCLATDQEHQPNLDFAAIRKDALRLAEATHTVGLLWEGETPDDFEPIRGIGKVFEQRLYDAGIRTYRMLATTTPEQLAEICRARPPQRPDYASWIRQARALLSGDA